MASPTGCQTRAARLPLRPWKQEHFHPRLRPPNTKLPLSNSRPQPRASIPDANERPASVPRVAEVILPDNFRQLDLVDLPFNHTAFEPSYFLEANEKTTKSRPPRRLLDAIRPGLRRPHAPPNMNEVKIEPQEQQQEQQLEFQYAVDIHEACRLNVLGVFPDIDHDHLARICDEAGWDPDTVVERILNDQDQNHPYPKAPKGKLKRKREENEDPSENAAKKWDSEDRRLKHKDGVYLKTSVQILQQFFPQFYMDDLRRVLEENGKLLYPTFLAMDKTVKEWDNNNPAFRTKKVTRQPYVPIDEANLQARIQACQSQTEREVLEEFAAVRATQSKVANEARAKQEEERRELENFEQAQAEGNVTECGCCFVDYAMNRMIHCDGNTLHWFCCTCAKTMAETQVGLGRHELACMSLDSCSASFAYSERDKFLDSSMKTALDRIEAEAALRDAGIENLETCPFCPFAAEYPPIEVDKEFRCLMADCRMVSCRACRKETHLPKTCEEAALEEGHSARHTVEEAMSAALIRKCNKCATPFIKENGCNKMSCTKCGNLQCYICSKSCDYSHFDDTRRGGKSGNCPLFDPNGIDARHMEEVEAAEAEAKKKVLEENQDISAEMLEIRTSEEVRQDEERRKLKRHGAAAAFPPAALGERLFARMRFPAWAGPGPAGMLGPQLRAYEDAMLRHLQHYPPLVNPVPMPPAPAPAPGPVAFAPGYVPIAPNVPIPDFMFGHVPPFPMLDPDAVPRPFIPFPPNPVGPIGPQPQLFGPPGVFGPGPLAPFNEGGQDQVMNLAQPGVRQSNSPRTPPANPLPDAVANEIPFRARVPAPPAPANGPRNLMDMPPVPQLVEGFEDLFAHGRANDAQLRLARIQRLRQLRDQIPAIRRERPLHLELPLPPRRPQPQTPEQRNVYEFPKQRQRFRHHAVERLGRPYAVDRLGLNPPEQQPPPRNDLGRAQQPVDQPLRQQGAPARQPASGLERNPIDLSSPRSVIDLTRDDDDDDEAKKKDDFAALGRMNPNEFMGAEALDLQDDLW